MWKGEVDRKIEKLEKENARFKKIFWLASKDELFFSTYNGKDWDDNWHPTLCCNDFFYAAADAEGIPEDKHIDETLDLLIELYNKFSSYGPLAWISLRRGGIDPPDWHWRHDNEKGRAKYEEAKEWLKTKNLPIVKESGDF